MGGAEVGLGRAEGPAGAPDRMPSAERPWRADCTAAWPWWRWSAATTTSMTAATAQTATSATTATVIFRRLENRPPRRAAPLGGVGVVGARFPGLAVLHRRERTAESPPPTGNRGAFHRTFPGGVTFCTPSVLPGSEACRGELSGRCVVFPGIVTFGSVPLTEFPGMMTAAAWRPPTEGFAGIGRGFKKLFGSIRLSSGNSGGDQDEKDQGTARARRSLRSRPGRAARGARGRALGRGGWGGHHLLHRLHHADHRHHLAAGAPADGRADDDCRHHVSTPPTSSGLAFTGADIEEMAIIGVVAIGVGAVLVRGRRRTA